MRYFIWCDESVTKGKLFSDFYGGVLVNTNDFESMNKALNDKFDELSLGSELKWQKINNHQEEGYKAMMDLFFEFIKAGKAKVRIMFTQNAYKIKAETAYQKQNKYHLLYYQFIKHAFGLKFIDGSDLNHLNFFFDRIPEAKEKNEIFKNHIYSLQRLPEFHKANIIIKPDDIAEVDSEKHIFLQCLDVVLGAMAFRLNKMHLAIPDGKKRRGKRTLAKERVYKHILNHIKQIYPNFNIGISTGLEGNKDNLWIQEYRHWRFLPYNWEVVEE